MTRSTTGEGGGRGSLWRKLRLHTWLGRLGWLFGLGVVVVVTCWLLVRMTPGWYLPLDPSDSAVNGTASRAESLYSELYTDLQRVPLGDQTWTITQDEVNSSLAVHAQAALDPTRGPISDPFVQFSKGRVTFAARITKLPGGDPQGGVGSATFSVGIVKGADGKAMGLVKLQSVHAGLLAVPKSLVESRMRAALPTIIAASEEALRDQMARSSRSGSNHSSDAMVEQIMRSVSTGEPFPLQFRWDKKDIVIKDLKVEEGRFTVVVGSAHPPVTVVPPPLVPLPMVPETLPALRGN